MSETQEVAQEEADESSKEDIALAKASGWVTLDKWKGDEENWTNAAIFNQRGAVMHKNLKDKNERLERLAVERETQMSELNATLTDVKEHFKRSSEADRKKFDAEIADLIVKKEQAVEDGDLQQFKKVEKQIAVTEESKPPPQVPNKEVEPQQQPANKDVVDFIARNDWFNKDLTLANIARTHLDFVDINSPDETLSQKLKQVEVFIRDNYPKQAGNQNRKKPQAVEGVGEASLGVSNVATYGGLSSEAKKQCDRVVNSKAGTREEWLAIYNSEK